MIFDNSPEEEHYPLDFKQIENLGTEYPNEAYDEFDEDLCILMLKENINNIHLITVKTTKVYLAAIEINPVAIMFIHDQNEEICLAAVRKNVNTAPYIFCYNKEIVRTIALANPFYLQYVPDQYIDEEFRAMM